MRKDRVGHGDIDVASAPGGSRLDERCEDAHCGHERSAQEIGDLEIRHDRRIFSPDLVADSGVAHVVDVVPGASGVGSVLPVTCDRAIDDAFIN